MKRFSMPRHASNKLSSPSLPYKTLRWRNEDNCHPESFLNLTPFKPAKQCIQHMKKVDMSSHWTFCTPRPYKTIPWTNCQICHLESFWNFTPRPYIAIRLTAFFTFWNSLSSAMQSNTFNIQKKWQVESLIYRQPPHTQTVPSTYERSWHVEPLLNNCTPRLLENTRFTIWTNLASWVCPFLPLQQNNTLNNQLQLALWVIFEI